MKRFLMILAATILVILAAYVLEDGTPYASRNFGRLLTTVTGRKAEPKLLPAPLAPGPVLAVATPAPAPTPEPEAKSIAVALPAPTPRPVATPDPNSPALIFQSLAASNEEWPRQVRTRKPVQFAVVINGAVSGSALLPAGTAVDLVAVKADRVAVTFQKAGQELAALDTDLVEVVRENRRRGIVPRPKPIVAATPDSVAKPMPAPAVAAIAPPAPPSARPGAKELLLPARISRVPAGNDYNNPDSEFCYQRSKSSDNFLLFWAREYGDDPMANSVARRRFNVDEVLKEADRFYDYYLNTLKWVAKDKSFATKYKFLLFVVGGTDNTAFGGSIDNKIGAFWTPATRINHGPYGVVAHELGHSFQAMSRADGAASFSGGGVFAEMTSQFMLWQVYPEWQTFEKYHLNDFRKATHLAFLHPDNEYHTCYPLEYWSYKHGVEFIGKMWREVQRGEDPVMTYKRLTRISQEQFNDEMFDASRRFVTWDLPRIEKVAAGYADQDSTSINRTADNWYQIDADKCPQNYGYNAIKLKVPGEGVRLKLVFKGIAGAEGFSQTQLEKAGWRYGFLAHQEDSSRVYSDISSKSDGSAEFTVPAKTKSLWLVVMGAPTEHWLNANANAARRSSAADSAGEQWPYKFNLTGTAPDDSIIH